MKRKWKDSGERLKYAERKERTDGWVRRKDLIQSDDKVRDFQELNDFLLFSLKAQGLGLSGWPTKVHIGKQVYWGSCDPPWVQEGFSGERPGTVHSTGDSWDRAEGREGWSAVEFRHRV